MGVSPIVEFVGFFSCFPSMWLYVFYANTWIPRRRWTLLIFSGDSPGCHWNASIGTEWLQRANERRHEHNPGRFLLEMKECVSQRALKCGCLFLCATFHLCCCCGCCNISTEQKLQTGEAGAILSTFSVYLTMLSKKALSWPMRCRSHIFIMLNISIVMCVWVHRALNVMWQKHLHNWNIESALCI